MANPTVSVNLPAQRARRVARATEGTTRVPTQPPVPVSAERLRTAVQDVLSGLASGEPDRQALRRFDATLRDGLAWTAATGDTCQLAGAVHAIRNARLRLTAGDPGAAYAALAAARDNLRAQHA